MYDSGKIIPGLIVFVLFVTFPIWYNQGDAKAVPQPVLPKDAKECVLPLNDIRSTHMQLLNQWRDDVIRRGDREYFEVSGEKYQKSLMNTCMACHTSKQKFCDTCHEYTSVKPYCWDCHIAPVE